MPRLPKARDPIRAAALKACVARGVHAASVRDIARDAGVSIAALYSHWPSKEDLVADIFRSHLAEVVERLDAAVAGGTVADQVRAAAAAIFRLYDEQPLVFRYVLLVQHDQSAQLPAGLRMPNDAVIDLIRAAIARSEIPACDPVATAALLVGMFLETATFVIYGRLPAPLAQHAGVVAEAALRVLRAR
jgi:AcrR family transcriptional regulator